jgi:ribosomal protein S18 acetylase RimI-like enzyme
MPATPASPEFAIRPFAHQDADAVIEVWRRTGLLYPTNDPRKDIARKLKVRPDLFLVGTVGGAVVATAMIGYEGHRGWINYLGVLPEHRRRGYALRLLEEAERLLRREGCPKINLQVRPGNAAALSFYERAGYSLSGNLSLGKRLEEDFG